MGVPAMRIDTRAGSRDYIEPLRLRGVTVEEAILYAGDMEIVGNGPGGQPVMVGVEHKKLDDLFQCIRNGRYSDQLRKMKESYAVSWLLIEGRMQVINDQLCIRRKNRWQPVLGGMSLLEVFGYIQTVSAAGGTLVYRTENKEESVEWLRSLNNWWTLKEWEQHRAHQDFYRPEQIGGNPLTQPSFEQRVARVFPGLGDARALAASQMFASVKEMANANPKTWQQVEGIGKKGSERLVRVLRGQK